MELYPKRNLAQVQRKAESEQSFVRPEIEERLQKAKLEAAKDRYFCTLLPYVQVLVNGILLGNVAGIHIW